MTFLWCNIYSCARLSLCLSFNFVLRSRMYFFYLTCFIVIGSAFSQNVSADSSECLAYNNTCQACYGNSCRFFLCDNNVTQCSKVPPAANCQSVNRSNCGTSDPKGDSLPTTTTLAPTVVTTPTTVVTTTTNNSSASTAADAATTTTTPSTPITSTAINPTKTSVTTSSSSVTESTSAETEHSTDSSSGRHFDAPSFIGGIVLSVGLLAIMYVGFKFYKARTERNYHTL